MHTWFKNQLPDWSSDNWTSGLRTDAGHPEFRENEARFADFTYDDPSQRMYEVLKSAGVPVSPKTKTYHLEIKSTPAGAGDDRRPMLVSKYQVGLVSSNETNCSHPYTDEGTTDEKVSRRPAQRIYPRSRLPG